MGRPRAIKPGMQGSAELVVGDEHTAPRVGSGKVRVLATPVMINLIEAAALRAVEHLLPAGYQSLGTVLTCATSPAQRLVAAACCCLGCGGKVDADDRFPRGGE